MRRLPEHRAEKASAESPRANRRERPEAPASYRGLAHFMILCRHRRRHHTLSYAVLSLLVFAVVMPVVIGSRLDRLAFRGAAALAAMRDSYALGAPLPLITSAGILLERGTVSISKTQSAATRTNEDMLNLLASGNARLVLDNAALVFTSEADVAAVPPPIDAAAPLIATLLGSHLESLRINHGLITLAGARGAPAVNLTDVNADISLRRKGVISAKGTFIHNRRTITFDTLIGVVGDRRAAHRLPISATLKSDLARISLEGRVSLGQGLQLSANNARLETPNLRDLAAWLGYDWPVRKGFEAFRAEGNLDFVDGNMSLQKATLALDGNDADGALFMTVGQGHPTLDATLAMRRLDLAPYLDVQSGASGGWLDVLRGAALPGLPILSDLDVDVRLSAERVTVGSAALGRGAATITAKQGRVIADVAEIELAGGLGSGSLQLSLDGTGAAPSYALRGKLKQVDVGESLPNLASGVPLLAGKADISADVQGAGRSVDDIVGSLSGQVKLSLPARSQVGLDLSALMAVAQPAAPQSKAVAGGWPVVVKNATTVDDLETRFDIGNGLWTLRGGRARSGNAVFVATGAVYPPTRSLDFRVSRTNGLAAATVSEDGVSLPAAAAQTVLVRGPWSEPQIVPAPLAGKAAEPALDPMPAPAPGKQPKGPGRG